MSTLRPHPGYIRHKRKRRARRALKLAWCVRIALVITVVFSLRTDAQLREALVRAGTDLVEQIKNPQSGPRASGALEEASTRNGNANALPTSRTRINRRSPSG